MWNTLNGIFQTKQKARVELNFFDYSDSKKYYSEPDVVEYEKNSNFLIDFWKVSKRLVKKPFSISKISMELQELEGFS
jgi:hypothetical protein